MEAKLFGSVVQPETKGVHSVPVTELAEPLPHEDYATRFFCGGCGTVLPVLREAVPGIVSSGAEPGPDQYIHTDRCDVCDSGFENARIKNIPFS